MSLLVEEALGYLLRGNTGLTSLVNLRMYPGILPQNVAYPTIAYVLVGREEFSHLSGRMSTGLARSSFRFFSVAKGVTAYAYAKRVNEALRLCLQGFSGTVGDGSSPEITLDIQGIELIGTREFYDDLTQTWQVQSDYDIAAPEEIPT